MVATKFGRYWGFTDALTDSQGKNNLNELIPMGFIHFRAGSDPLDVYVNGLNWIITGGTIIEEDEFGPITLTDDADNYIWIDDAGAIQQGTTAFPDATSEEYFACGIVTTADGAIVEIKHIGMTSKTAGSADLSGLETDVAALQAAKKSVILKVFPIGTPVAASVNADAFPIPVALNGLNLTRIYGRVRTAGETSGTFSCMATRTRAGVTVDMLSTALTWDIGETGTDTALVPAVIDAANDDVQTNDIIGLDIDTVHGTPAQGEMWVVFEFNN